MLNFSYRPKWRFIYPTYYNPVFWYHLKFWEKFEIHYTNRIYKIFFKTKFIRMTFNHAHPTIVHNKTEAWYIVNHPYEKILICWFKVPYYHFNAVISQFVNIRRLNFYTWRGLYYSRWMWTKKVGKISEYV